MGNVLIFAEHQGGHFPKTTLTAIHAGLDLAKKRGGAGAIAVVSRGMRLRVPQPRSRSMGLPK